MHMVVHLKSTKGIEHEGERAEQNTGLYNLLEWGISICRKLSKYVFRRCPLAVRPLANHRSNYGSIRN